MPDLVTALTGAARVHAVLRRHRARLGAELLQRIGERQRQVQVVVRVVVHRAVEDIGDAERQPARQRVRLAALLPPMLRLVALSCGCGTAAGSSAIRSAGLRPLSGSSTMRLLSITWPTPRLRVSTSLRVGRRP